MNINWEQNRRVILTATAALSAVGGAAIGALVAMKILKEKYNAIIQEEVHDAKQYYKELYKKQYKSEEYSTPEKAAETLGLEDSESEDDEDNEEEAEAPVSIRRVLETYSGSVNVEPEDPREKLDQLQSISSIFEGRKRELDWDLEDHIRATNDVYVISVDEFTNEESGYEQINLMYYDGDDVVTDERNSMVEAGEVLALLENNLKFGYGSDDDHTVYIRNVKRQLEFEVIRNLGSYSVQVLGLASEDELEHSDRRKPRKFRGEHE